MTKKYASIILDNNIEKLLEYAIPEELFHLAKKGSRVEVPLKNFKSKGYIFEIKSKTNLTKIKSILNVISKEVVSDDLFSLIVWMAKYYCVSIERIMRSIIPTAIRKDIKQKTNILLTCGKSKADLVKLCQNLRKKSPTQAHIIELFLKNKGGIYLKDLLSTTKVSKSPIDSLIKKKVLLSKKINFDETDNLIDEHYFLTKPKKLSDEQEIAFNKIKYSIENNLFQTHLIYGITGSGKTEIYMQAIQQAIDLNKTVIMLVPEVALTGQTIERLKARFKDKIAILHHKRSHGQRSLAWSDIIGKKAPIVVGARSAVFSPSKNLGLLIVDEEHDSSYKQTQEAPTYHAKNIAIMRAKLCNATVILGSATPSLESYKNALDKKFILSTLKKRPNDAKLAQVQIVDMKHQIKTMGFFSYFSDVLLDKIKKRFEKGEQTLLFLNKRGFHSYMLCTNCSSQIKCPHCDIALTFHKKENILSCHLCNHQITPTKTCPSCKSDSCLKFKGTGTELIQASLNKIFPQIRTLRIDRDTTSQKHSHDKLLKEFRSGKADVLIGTQMIVKGLHFPSVTLVGVLNSDGALNIPDFRSGETVFQLITQVAGRAGRSYLPGEVVIQTFMPDNSIIKFASKQDYDGFYEQEIQARDYFNYPPFSQIVKFVFSGKCENDVINICSNFRATIIKKLTNDFNIHPTIPCGHAKIKDHFRYQFLIRGKKINLLTNIINQTKKEFTIPSSINFLVDIDPLSTFF
jgi:primosomal protein N' (replication factor Y) (superfamily II helicase)